MNPLVDITKLIPVPSPYGVYEIICKATGRPYYGESRNIQERVGGHIARLNKNNHINKSLQSDWLQYGHEGFIFNIVACGPEYTNELKRLELETDLIENSPITPYNTRREVVPNQFNAKEVKVAGVLFPSITLAAKATGTALRTMSHYVKENTLDGLEIKHSEFLPENVNKNRKKKRVVGSKGPTLRIKVSIDNTQYESIRAACKALGQTRKAIIPRLKDSAFPNWGYVADDGQLTKTPPVETFSAGSRRVKIMGVEYASITAAADALGKGRTTIARKLHDSNILDYVFLDEAMD